MVAVQQTPPHAWRAFGHRLSYFDGRCEASDPWPHRTPAPETYEARCRSGARVVRTGHAICLGHAIEQLRGRVLRFDPEAELFRFVEASVEEVQRTSLVMDAETAAFWTEHFEAEGAELDLSGYRIVPTPPRLVPAPPIPPAPEAKKGERAPSQPLDRPKLERLRQDRGPPKPRRPQKPRFLGVVLWKGPSQIDGKPVVVIANGYLAERRGTKKQSRKLGAALQVWVLREDLDPLTAVQQQEDGSICGDCELRGNGRKRGCFVQVQWWPRTIWRTYRAGRYRDLSDYLERGENPFEGRTVRIASYGDPAAVPAYVWEYVRAHAKVELGYTRQWRNRRTRPELAEYAMASVFSPAERERARRRGYRTFRAIDVPRDLQDDEAAALAYARSLLLPGEVLCPNYSHGTTCADCGLCDGKRSEDDRRADIANPIHGAPKVQAAFREAVGHRRLKVLR